MEPIIQLIKAAAESHPQQSASVIVQLASALAPFLETGATEREANADWANSQGKSAACHSSWMTKHDF